MVEQADSLTPQRFPHPVQPGGQFPDRLFVAIGEAVHPCNHRVLRPQRLSLGGGGRDVLFHTVQVHMQADHPEAGFLYQPGPVQPAAPAHRHAGGFGDEADQKAAGVDHKAAQLDPVIPGVFHFLQRVPGLGFVTQHKLLDCFDRHG